MLTFSTNPDVAEQQMNAIIFYMTAFGYIDGNFDFTEKTFVRIYIRQLVTQRAKTALPDADDKTRDDVINRFTTHFHEVFEQIDRNVKALFDEAVADGEDVEKFVYSKLKLRSYEIFQSFDRQNQVELLATIDELIYADGSVHEAEKTFREEIEALLLDRSMPLGDSDIEVVPTKQVDITAPLSEAAVKPKMDDHPFFQRFEHHYAGDPDRIRPQIAADLDLLHRFSEQLTTHRKAGEGKLKGKQSVADFKGQAPFLDGHVYVHPAQPDRIYELTVLGDLHGCYSCLKSAVLQADFFAKLEAWKLDPMKPEPKLILLGDYIDRGMFSYNGVLRSIMQLYLSAPDHVFPLRGNHEYYIEYRGRIYGGVKPAEAINTLIGLVPGEVFQEYMKMFEEMPNMLFFDDLMFVHAGIPRDADIKAKIPDMSGLNDPDIRFQMLWSDPSTADYIPDELQAQNARFPFGKKQFEAFMARLGCSMMVRGHEKVDSGFKTMYGDVASLLSMFSAGGAENNDLPPDSSYRSVTPMAATIRLEGGNTQVTPWLIDYKRFNDPKRNRFFATEPEIEHKVG
jgi:uncharacterized tellurite resistance protein B-like protein